MTRDDLINLVLDNIDRPDIRDTNPNQPGYWIKRAEQRLERELRMRETIVRRMVPVSAGFITLPSDFIQAENFALNSALTGARVRKLEYASPQQMDDYRATALSASNVSPAYFSVIGQQIELFPAGIFDVNGVSLYTLEMAYYPKLVPLVNPADTNWLLENKLDIYVNAVTRYAMEFLQEDARAQAMDSQLSTDVQILNMAKDISITAGSRLVVRTKSPVGVTRRRR